MANKSVGLLNIVFGANLKGFDRAMKKAQKTMDRFGKKMTSLGKDMSMRLTLPILGLAGAAIKYASEMQESFDKVRVVFGESTKEIDKFTDNTLRSFNISKIDALEMIGTFGAMGTALGFTQEQAAVMSKTLVGLAGDMSSFNDIPVEEAQTALKGVFTGETEALKNLGIITTEATLKNNDYFLSLGKTWKELTNNEKIAIRFNEVLKQTESQHGNVIETGESFANQLRSLQGASKELAAEFGEIMLPIATKLVKKVKQWIAAFSGLSTTTKQVVIVIGLVAAALGPLLIIFGQMAIGVSALIPIFASLNAIMIANPIGLVISAIGLLIGAFFYLKESGSEVARQIRNFFATMANGVIISINKLIDAINLINPFEKIDNVKLFTLEVKKEFKETGDQILDAADSVQTLTDKFANLSEMGSGGGGGGGGTGGGSTDLGETLIGAAPDEGTQIMPEGFIGPLQQFQEMAEGTLFENLDFLENKVTENTTAFQILHGSVKSTIQQFSELASRGAKSFKVFGKTLKQTALDAIGANISVGVSVAIRGALESAKNLPPFLIPIITSLAAGLAKTAFNQLIPPFAQGGLVTGATIGLVGEGSGTSAFNPEVIAPLDKLMGMMGGTKVQVSGSISGQDIILVTDKAEISQDRIM
jgi:hypothetical protein